MRFIRGSPDASSIYLWKMHEFGPRHAFSNATKGFWRSKARDELPQFIWYQFDKAEDHVRPTRVLVQTRGKYASRNVPTRFQFIGIVAEKCGADAEWVVLCEARATTNLANPFGCAVNPGRTEKFQCLGLKILEIENSSTCEIKRIQMWRHDD